MPPRKTATKTASSKERETNHDAAVTSTPRRSARTYHLRGKNSAQPNDDLSEEEPDTPGGAGEATLTEPESKALGTNNQSTAGTNPGENPQMLRRSSRTSSISLNEIPVVSPSSRDTSMKKHDFVNDTTAEAVDKPDELADEPTSKKRRVDVKPVPRITLRKSRSKWEDPDEMLTNPRAPLAHAKLRDILCSPESWEILTSEEKRQILAKFPDDAEILDPGTPSARPDIVALLNNNNFRYDIERYKEGLRQGFHDPDWIQQAQAAHRSRHAGLYDEFIAADFEDRWGMSVFQQTPAPHNSDGDKGGHTGHSAEGWTHNGPLESEITASSKSTAVQSRSINDKLDTKSTAICQDDYTEDKVESKAGLTCVAFESDGKKVDPLHQNNIVPAGLSRMEDTIAQKPSGQKEQQPENITLAVEASSIEAQLRATNGGEPRGTKEPSDACQKAQQTNIEDAATNTAGADSITSK